MARTPCLALSVDIVAPSVGPVQLQPGEEVKFEAIAHDDWGQDLTAETQWTWDFGDGQKSNQNPVWHVFNDTSERFISCLCGSPVIHCVHATAGAHIIVPGIPQQVIQRGNSQEDVFLVEGDRGASVEFLGEQAEKHGLALVGYCLIDNHVHLVATGAEATSLARTVGRREFRHTQ